MPTAVSRILDHLRDDDGLQGKDIANIVAVSPATVSRWFSGKATPDLHTQTVIAELRYVVDWLNDFCTPNETWLWLHTPHQMLHGERAIDLINAGRTAKVLAVIESLDTGAFTQVPSGSRRARDLQLLDHIDAYPYVGTLWRVVRDGRDPSLPGRAPSRWCTGAFDVLYAALERNGAIAEVHALLSLQPVFPSKIAFHTHRLRPSVREALHLTDLPTLGRLGVDVERYQTRDYTRTQEIADAAHFLGFDGQFVPNARWPCTNAVLFADRIEPGSLSLERAESKPIDWPGWRRRSRA